MEKFDSKSEAVKILTALGLKKNYSLRNREYWWKNDGTDIMVDYSATITKIDNKFYISCFL